LLTSNEIVDARFPRRFGARQAWIQAIQTSFLDN
jgi:hypothetical protein